MNTPHPAPVTFRMVEDMPNLGRDRRFGTGFNSMPVIPRGAFIIFDPAHPRVSASGRAYDQPARVRIVWAGGVTDVPREKAHQFMTESKWQVRAEPSNAAEVMVIKNFGGYAVDDLLQHLIDTGRLTIADVAAGVDSLLAKWEQEEQ